MSSFCPATMCPLFAADGSPWTGEQNAPCSREACGWWSSHVAGMDGKGPPHRCTARGVAAMQVATAKAGDRVLQLGPTTARHEKVRPRSFDCPRAKECQWQIEAGIDLCPPRRALAEGVDPRAVAY